MKFYFIIAKALITAVNSACEDSNSPKSTLFHSDKHANLEKHKKSKSTGSRKKSTSRTNQKTSSSANKEAESTQALPGSYRYVRYGRD